MLQKRRTRRVEKEYKSLRKEEKRRLYIKKREHYVKS
jgi:hypothetical protein